MAILDRRDRVLYTGDSVQDGHIYMFGAHRQPDAFAASLDKLLAVHGYDTLRAAHGTPELPAAFVQKVRDAWQQVLNGEIESHPQDLHGRTVNTFAAADCGFYCN